tara:strand:+ start:107 stop:388 length:282 start_codon:yes stop_codon:yes gene_type:complete
MSSKKEFIVNKKVLISDIITEEEKGRKDYVESILNMPDMNKRKRYDVMICKLDEGTVLLKPIKKYNCMVFEELFGFGYNCDGFDVEKVIKLRK